MPDDRHASLAAKLIEFTHERSIYRE